jgi:hypothetical protein
MIWPSTRSSGSFGWISRPMSTVQPAERARPVSAAMPRRRSAYPSKPSARQNRVTVAGEVPLRSASSTMVARDARAGSASTCSATRRSAPVNSGTSARMRTSTRSAVAAGSCTADSTTAVAVPSAGSTISPPSIGRIVNCFGKSSY